MTWFESQSEANYFLSMVSTNQDILARGAGWIYIDGVSANARSTTEWYSTNSGNKANFSMVWAPSQPDCYFNSEFCLSFGRGLLTHPMGFNDISCQNSPLPFVCQANEVP